ncbi:MAG TPA: methyltransferase domain-containing protein [Spirochaetota bacterium]|nr:methyltransferase domain-containing protein [Spirochaetota bacterium]HPJ40213.1 methyltransferase domain-containing protein [Spirochaetota bacterium]HPQ54010.1 methyltransferase domain-containing protein [Spirochaetota bacterium]
MKASKKSFIEELKKLGIRKQVVESYGEIDPKYFYDSIFHKRLYTDETMPIGGGETSDPFYVLARMLHHADVKKTSRVLEIGTGAGFSTALLGTMGKDVISIEYHEKLAAAAKERIRDHGFRNIRLFAGDGTTFEEEIGMFDAIIVLAACYTRPINLIRNLKVGGRIVFPMGPIYQQQIAVMKNEMERREDELMETRFYDFCSFRLIRGPYGTDLYPLIGTQEEDLRENS